jgi:peptide/nickel transport system ATP-binding protein
MTPQLGTDSAAAERPLLEVENLRVSLARSGTDIVDAVSFSVAAGQVMGVVGESGSGKTAVAHALMGHARRGLVIDGGTVRLAGRDVLGLGDDELRALRGTSVAYVPQDPSSALNPALKIGTQLREIFSGRWRSGGTTVDQRIDELLHEVRLTGRASILRAYPHQLSGGQQQRVMLAMAFACRPQLIVLDEPTTGLDVTTQRHILETIRALCAARDVAAVYLSHDLAVVGELTQTVGVMYAGRLVELGPTEAVFRAPAHPYTRGLLRAIPSPHRAQVLEGIEGRPPRPGARPAGCFFAPRCAFAVAACRETLPPPVNVPPAAHWARCIRVDEVLGSPPLGALPSVRSDGGQGEGSALIAVRGVSAAYGGAEVLRNVDVTLQPNRCLALVGESGAGKTTLARCLVGLHSDWTGEITLQGVPLAHHHRQRGRELARDIQYVFQNPYNSLNPRKTIEQLLEQPLRHLADLSKAERRERVVEALEDVTLGPEYLRKYPDQLSGGERQRVAIARALAVSPQVLVCDEVTSALDVSVQAAVVELLRRLRDRDGLALVMITHNLALVRSLADDVAILRSGEVVEQGAAATVLDSPRSEYAAELLSNVPTLSVVG